MECRYRGETHSLVVYPEEFESLLASGESMEKAGRYAAELIQERRRDMPEVAKTPEEFRNGLFIQMVNAARNPGLVEGTIHDSMEDMAAIVRCKVATEEGAVYSFRVTKESLGLFLMTESEVLMQAYQNTAGQEFRLRNVGDILREMMEKDRMPQEMIEETFSQKAPLYVLTNPEQLNGANVMVCPETLHKVYEELGEPYYVLPSSIHEVMVVKESEGMDVGQMKQTVREVNESTVSPEELLSFQVFRYDGKKLSAAREDVEKASEVLDKAKHHKWTM